MIVKKIVVFLFFFIIIVLPLSGIYGSINCFFLFFKIYHQMQSPIVEGQIIAKKENVFYGIGFRPELKVKLKDGTEIDVLLLSDLKNITNKTLSINYDGNLKKRYFYINNISMYLIFALGVFALIAATVFVFIVYKYLLKKLL